MVWWRGTARYGTLPAGGEGGKARPSVKKLGVLCIGGEGEGSRSAPVLPAASCHSMARPQPSWGSSSSWMSPERAADSSRMSLALSCPLQEVCQQVPTALGFLCPQPLVGWGSACSCAGAVTLLAAGRGGRGDGEGTRAPHVPCSPCCSWPCPQREEPRGALLPAALAGPGSPVLPVSAFLSWLHAVRSLLARVLTGLAPEASA